MSSWLADPVEIAEYLAQYIRREIRAGGFNQEDVRDSPEIRCLEQVAEIAPELTGQGLPLSKCEAYDRPYDQHPRSR